MSLLTKKETNGVAAVEAPRRTITPRYDVRENGPAFTVTVWLPGVDRDSLETTLDGDTLKVIGRRAFAVPAEWTPLHREIAQTDFQLTLELDRRFNREAVQAELSQGVLTLTLPKAEAVKPRAIEIK